MARMAGTAMVGTRSHAESSVNERRLRPVYDYLDNGNYKKALQEADKLLKKQKDFACAKALKALALIRMARNDEGLVVLQGLLAEAPTDDHTLQAMTICYRDLEKPELVVEVYERATQKETQNEELLSHLFMAYVRVGDYKKQRKTAMALHKLKHNNPYYFWAVMSIVMEASVEAGEVERGTLLLLAERMVDKLIKEERMEAEAEVQLYIMILEMQGKFQEALNALDGPLGESLASYQDFLPQRKVALLKRLGRWPEVNLLCKAQLLRNPDQWCFLEEYLQSVQELKSAAWTPESMNDKVLDPCPDHTLEMALHFLDSLATESGHVTRGPYLARVQAALQNDQAPKALDLVVEFFEKVAHKPSCALDLSHLLTTNPFSSQDIIQLLSRMEDSLKTAHPSDWQQPPDVNSMQRHLCLCQLKHYVGNQTASLSSDEQWQLAQDLLSSYRNGLRFGENLLPTDFQPADNYVILSAEVLIELWKSTGECRWALRLLAHLEQALQQSPYSFQIKLLLLKVYSAMGAVGPCSKMGDSLDLKHIQHDTLGYLVCPSLLRSGHWQAASAYMSNALKLYTGNSKDTTDYLISCYKYGSFTKIQEILKFRERLNNSLQFALLTAEKMILEVITESKSPDGTHHVISSMEIDPVRDETAWQDLTDNRDVRVFREWSASHREMMEDALAKTRKDEVTWLQVRNLLLRAVAACYALAPPVPLAFRNCYGDGQSNGDDRASGVNQMLELTASLCKIARGVDTHKTPGTSFPIQCPAPSRLELFAAGHCLDTLVVLLQWSATIYKAIAFDDSKSDMGKEQLVLAVEGLVPRLKSKSTCSLLHMQQFLEELSNITEVLSWGAVFLNCVHTWLKPLKHSVNKKAKRKRESAAQDACLEQYGDVLAIVENATAEVKTVMKETEVAITSTVLSRLHLQEQEDEVVQGTELVHQKVEQSYKDTLQELSAVLDSKARLLKNIHL
ncbi:N-alpha-acetyltransferase 25, NatB auxiliary subunit-like [Ornithodoros turicata]|uniref:N-alpha-acetyltransferase 25, NatB auxiliary subunit-like n=1 Tax=Ornithodoros turicata TaxID=34597 RepID=UPI00313A46C0